jgi:predicted murein hydrolase (TIGR00659 family)
MNVWGAWQAVTSSPLFGMTITLAAYWLATVIWARTGRHSAANPVLITIVLIATAITVLRVPYEEYFTGAQFINFLLGPATVALGLPLYRQAATIRRAAPIVIAGITTGSVTAIATGYWITKALGGSREMALSMAPKSATTPITIALSQQIGGVPSLSAVFAIVAGITGAVAAPRILNLLRITDPRARGLAIGVASHGLGTSRALLEDETTGAFSGLAMALNGLATSLLVEIVLRLIRA